MSLLDDFLALVKSKIGCGYVYGSQGEIMTRKRLNQLISVFGRDHYYGAKKDAAKWIGLQCFDCSGLVIWSLQQIKTLKKGVDYSSHNIFHQLCTPVSKDKLEAGDLCFVYDKSQKRIVHVGVYIGENQVVHARGTAVGVVRTGVLPYFSLFGRLNALQK